MSTQSAPGPYICRFCRLTSDGTAMSCPNCGAPVDVRARVSDSGWTEQPPVRDMARIEFGRSTCQIEGTIVPTADMSLVDTDSVYFSHHVLLWTEPSVTMSPMPMKGGWNRMLAGMPLVMMQAHGPGHVAFSEDAPGEIVVIPLQHGQNVDVREHRFLVAGANVVYDWFQSGIWYTTSSGNDSETHYPLGRFLDRFRAEGGPGLLLLHSPGNTFVRDLRAGEAICIQPSALLYKDPGVGMMLHFEYPNVRGMSWGANYTSRTVWLRLWGPGRVAMQSVFERPESGKTIQRHSDATQTQW
jgi:uncharacterized protein (AIM24 family)